MGFPFGLGRGGGRNGPGLFTATKPNVPDTPATTLVSLFEMSSPHYEKPAVRRTPDRFHSKKYYSASRK
jgi:hypothetical protein